MPIEDFLWDVYVDVFGAWEHLFPDTWLFADQKNPHFRLWHLAEGEIAAEVLGASYQVRPSDTVLWPAAEQVRFRNTSGSQLRMLSILFTLQSRTGYRYRSFPCVPFFLSNLDELGIQERMGAIIEEMEQRRMGYRMSANSKLQELLVDILRAGNYLEPTQSDAWMDAGHKEFPLGGILKLLQEKPECYPTTKQMADMASVSEVHLRRLFHKYYLVSPGRFVRKYKIRESKHALRESTLSIAEIAYSLGFESSNYFSKVFQQEQGCSPSDFRRMFRSREQDGDGEKDETDHGNV